MSCIKVSTPLLDTNRVPSKGCFWPASGPGWPQSLSKSPRLPQTSQSRSAVAGGQTVESANLRKFCRRMAVPMSPHWPEESPVAPSHGRPPRPVGGGQPQPQRPRRNGPSAHILGPRSTSDPKPQRNRGTHAHLSHRLYFGRCGLLGPQSVCHWVGGVLRDPRLVARMTDALSASAPSTLLASTPGSPGTSTHSVPGTKVLGVLCAVYLGYSGY